MRRKLTSIEAVMTVCPECHSSKLLARLPDKAKRPKQAMDDEEEHLERQREHWEERAAIERDYIQLY